RTFLYDLFNGGPVPVNEGKAKLRLAAGGGGCWVALTEPAGDIGELRIEDPEKRAHLGAENWNDQASRPMPIRLINRAGIAARGNSVLGRAPLVAPGGDRSALAIALLGRNAAPGTWTFEVHDPAAGKTTRAAFEIKPAATALEGWLYV